MRQKTNTGSIVKDLRTGHRMKQITLGAHLKVDENYIYMVERGLRVPSLKFILGFARLFGINKNWIFEKWIRDFLLREEQKIREQFQKMILKKLPDLRLAPALNEPTGLVGHLSRPTQPSKMTVTIQNLKNLKLLRMAG